MNIGNFNEALQIGKKAEQFAERFFKSKRYDFQDVRNDPKYQAIDVDYIVNGELYEVKQNLHIAQKGIPGEFILIELSIDEKPGWWQFTKADYFLFCSPDHKRFVKIRVKDIKDTIESAIKNESHSSESLYRFDYKKDNRLNKVVVAKSMRVYLSEIEGYYQMFVTRHEPKII
jgi:hypothetical protein